VPVNAVHGASVVTRVLVVVIPSIVALTLGISRGIHVPAWRDEYATAMHAALSAPDLVRSLSGGDAVQGPYYLLIHLLSPVLGLGIGIRVLSLLAFAATAAIVSMISLRWWGPVAAAATGIFFSLNGAAVIAGMTARPYALMLMLVALAIFAADRADGRRRWVWAGYGAAAALAVAMHLISIIALLCIGLLGLGRSRAWLVRWVLWTVPALTIGVALAVIGGSQQKQISWLPSPGLRSGISALAQVAGVSAYRAVVWDGVGLIILAAAAGAAIVTLVRAAEGSSRSTRLRPVLFASVLGFAGPAALFAYSWIATPVYNERYLSWVSLGSAFIVGAAVYAATLRDRIPSAIAGVCAAILITGASWVAAQQSTQPPGLYDDVPSLVGELHQGADVGDALAIIQRNPHSGAAYSLAQQLADHEWSSDIVDRLRQSAQPTVEVRLITGTTPLDLEATSSAPLESTERTLWVVSLDSPSEAELEGIGRAVGCTADSSGKDPMLFGGMRLYDVACR